MKKLALITAASFILLSSNAFAEGAPSDTDKTTADVLQKIKKQTKSCSSITLSLKGSLVSASVVFCNNNSEIKRSIDIVHQYKPKLKSKVKPGCKASKLGSNNNIIVLCGPQDELLQTADNLTDKACKITAVNQT